MTSRCCFDDSLPWLIEVLSAELGPGFVGSGVVLRDATGRLSFFVDRELSDTERARVSALIHARLGSYARSDRVLVEHEAAGAGRIFADPGIRAVEVGGTAVRYLDRRIVGSDWLRAPVSIDHRPPRLVFSSLKGGVGRSTALSIVAADQARLGRNVLVVDLDLEALGIGSMLLGRERRPALGVLDYLVERNLGTISQKELDAFVGTSTLTSGAGLVDVVPVAGTRSHDEPQNFLSKLSRAMVEELSDAGNPTSVAEKIAAMLDALEARRFYDVVLVDARAGLAELAAGPLLGLGANVLLFGTWQAQTTEGLRFLFAHLSSLREEGKPSPWQALKMVHAKAQLAEGAERFKDELWELFSEYLYEEVSGLEGFNFDVGDPEAPHNPIVIPLDSAFADWNPEEKPSKLVNAYYVRAFGDLIQYVDDVLKKDAP